MAAPAFRSAGTTVATASSSTNITPGAPSGATNNDILILFAFGKTDDEIGDIPNISANGAGWTEITSTFTDAGSYAISGRAWWYRVSGSVPTMPSVASPDTGGDGIFAKIAAYSGCITSGSPIEDPDATSSGGLAAWTGVAVTTTDTDRLIVQMFGSDDDTNGNPASGWTENAEQINSTGFQWSVAFDSKTRASAGTESAPTRSNGNERYSAVGFALIPEPPASNVDIPVPLNSSPTVTGLAPTVTATANITVDVPVNNNPTVTGLVPTVTASDNQTIAIPLNNSPTVTGLAPTIAVSDNQTIAVPLNSDATATGLAPTVDVTVNQTIAIPLANIDATGNTPTVLTPLGIDIPLNSDPTVQGYAPTVAVTAVIGAFVAGSDINGGSGTAATVDYPIATQAGDYICLLLSKDQDQGTITPPSGFTHESTLSDISGSNQEHQYYIKVADGTETGTITSATWTGTQDWVFSIRIIRNAHGRATSSVLNTADSNLSSFGVSGVTPIYDNMLITGMMAVGTGDSTFTLPSNTNANFAANEEFDFSQGSGTGGVGQAFGWHKQTTATATGTTTFTQSTAAPLFMFTEVWYNYPTVQVPVNSNATVTGLAPTVLNNVSIAIPVNSDATVTGLTPTVSLSDNQYLDIPLNGNATVTGLVPTVDITENIYLDIPLNSNPTVTGLVPTVLTPNTISMTQGEIVVTGYAPTVPTAEPVEISIPLGMIDVSGKLPQIIIDNIVYVPVNDSPTVTGYAPTVLTPRNIQIPSVSSIEVTGNAPTVTTPYTIQIPKGSITASGKVPTVDATAHIYIDIPANTDATVTGLTPTVTATENVLITVPLNSDGTVQGYAPTVSATQDVLIAMPIQGRINLTGYVINVQGSNTEDRSINHKWWW